jgi:hypothetical protein
MSWQPISTAPKDGTRVLAFGRGTEKAMWPVDELMPEIMSVIFWSWHDTEEYEPAEGGLYRQVKRRCLEMWKPIGPHFFKPTHWQPLPEPPDSK